MPNLAQLSDYDPMGNYTGGIVPVDQPAVAPSSTSSTVDKVINNLLRDDDKRYQLWPEKVAREAFTAAHDVGTGEAPQWAIDPNSGDVHTSPQMIEKAQAISAAAGTGGLGGVTDATLGATPFLRPALKYENRIYKAPIKDANNPLGFGAEHSDALPTHLADDFYKKAMSGEDINHYNFGFMNEKGQFLDREKALEHGINTGLVDPSNGRYGVLTSTMLADSSKPGTAIEAMAKAEPFYSALEHNVKNIKQEKMTGDAWLGTLSNKPGVKPEELDWTGLKGFLEENKGKPVTKGQIEEHLANNKVELKEVSKGVSSDPYFHYMRDNQIADKLHTSEDIALARQHNAIFREIFKGMSNDEILKLAKEAEASKGIGKTKYHSYQLPGGENYREMLMTLPDKSSKISQRRSELENIYKNERQLTPQESAELDSLPRYTQGKENNYKSSHWDEPNILAHVRMNDRTIDGKKSLHLEEIQSDWHQQGRDKGYAIPDSKPKNVEVKKATNGSNGYVVEVDGRPMVATATLERATARADELRNTVIKGSGVPDAPFKKTWHELALKRMIREAAEKGYDRLSWTPGEAQAARYDLSKSVEKVHYDENGLLTAYDKSGKKIIEKTVEDKELPDIIGKEAAEKLIKTKLDPEGNRVLNNQDLKIGGEGMKGFYDQIIPKSVNKLAKEYGAKVETGKTKEGHTVHYIELPKKLKDVALSKGFPLFSAGVPYQFIPVDHDPFEKKK